jgi:carotenoid cleavage dioxygenase-like enzyme
MESGRSSRFDFGETSVAGEPVFAARPGGGPDDGWLITQVLDGATEKSCFAVFDAARVADGPLVKLRLPHHLPISFHGWWRPDGPG